MNGGDNPPDYNPDIINNQLITTFGTTTAPNNFAFGSVNVRPTPQQHLEHTFNTTDLTQEAIELAIDDAPGLDVHTVGINQEQIVGNGAPINESALTIINWGKYRLRTLGLHQIATADNSNNWVVPALMEVNIPLIQNQVIDHSGTYRIVQRTVNGETGLVIEEYIPEPEPNNNTRDMIIDEDEEENNNNDNGEIILRGQNNVRGLPDPTGEAIEGNFVINIPQSTLPIITNPITINGYYKFNGNTLISGTDQDYNINVSVPSSSNTKLIKAIAATMSTPPVNTPLDATLTNSLQTKNALESFEIYGNQMGLIIQDYTNYYKIRVKCNRTNSSTILTANTSYYYKLFDVSSDSRIYNVTFYDDNNQYIFSLEDVDNDNIVTITNINKNTIVIDL